MKRFTILLTLLIFTQGCKDHEGSSVLSDGSSNRDIKISELLEQEGQLTFSDSSESSGTCTFRFQNDGTVVLSSFAYNFCKFHGSFREVEGQILIMFDTKGSEGGMPFLDAITDPEIIHLPPLSIHNTSEGFTLIRNDARTDFKEHWNVYPDAMENIFPLRIVTTERAQVPKQSAAE